MNPILFQLGLTFAALALLLYTIMSFFTGAAYASGSVVRSGLAPTLKSFRSTSTKRRDQLADGSVLVGVVLAGCAALITISFTSAIIAVVLFKSRAQIRTLTRSEHPLMALTTDLSGDLFVGLLVPLAMVFLLLKSYLIALAIFAVVVALCWPAGGAGRPAGQWKPAWVAG